MENPKDYRIRLYLPTSPEIHPEAWPNFLDVRPRRLGITYKELAHESQTEVIDYFGLYVQRNVYQKVIKVNGVAQYANLITKGNYSYVWDANGLPTLQNLAVYYCLRDGSFDPKPEMFPDHLVQPKSQNAVLKNRRAKIVDDMASKAIALGIGQYSKPFFKKYSLLVNNFINAGDEELLEVLSSITPLPPDNEQQENWVFIEVPGSASILASLTPAQREYLSIHQDAEAMSIKEVLLLNFWMATLIPSSAEIAGYLSVNGVGQKVESL